MIIMTMTMTMIFMMIMIVMIMMMMTMMLVTQVNFTVVAREVAAGGRESRASVVVHVRDLNDNPPIFLEVSDSYIPHNTTRVVKCQFLYTE